LNVEVDIDVSIQLLSYFIPSFSWQRLSHLLREIPGFFCLEVDDENSVRDFSVDPSVQIFILFIYQLSIKESSMDKTSSGTSSFISECNSTSSLLNMIRLGRMKRIYMWQSMIQLLLLNSLQALFFTLPFFHADSVKDQIIGTAV
jgi:hypothetical protein